MTVIVSVNPELAEFEVGEGPTRLSLVLTDKDDQQHSLILEGNALPELATLFRAFQAQFPGALGVH